MKWLWVAVLAPFAVFLAAWAHALFQPSAITAVQAALSGQGVLRHTAAYGLGTAAAGTAIGWLFAHVLHTYRTPGRRVLHLLGVSPLLMPSFAFGMALIILVGHNGFLTQGLGWSSLDIYGLGGLVVAGTLSRLPLAYLTIAWAYRRIDPTLLAAAASLGASGGRITRLVVVPRLLPSVASVFLILLGDAITDLANPLVIGGGYGTLATRMYEALNAEGDQTSAAVYAALLAVPAVLFWLAALRIGNGPADRFRAAPPAPGRQAGPTGRVLQALAWLIAGSIAAMLAAVVVSALVPTGAVTGLTGVHFVELVAGPRARALATSVLIALIAAPAVAVIGFGLCAAAATNRRALRRSQRLLGAVSAVPPAVLGLGAALALTLAATQLQEWRLTAQAATWGALALILGVHLVRFAPRSTLPALPTTSGLLPGLRDSAVTLGVSRRALARRLLWPSVRPQLTSSAATTFARSLTAVSSVILLTNSQVPLLPVTMLTDIDAGHLGPASAATLVMAVVIAAAGGASALVRATWARTSVQERAEVG